MKTKNKRLFCCLSLLFISTFLFVDSSYAIITRGSVRTRNIFGVRRTGISSSANYSSTKYRLGRSYFGNTSYRKGQSSKKNNLYLLGQKQSDAPFTGCYGESISLCKNGK